MPNSRIIKVLIVDDSILFREGLIRGLAKDPYIKVVGTAPDPFVARDKILELEPDVMTLDIEMPRMNGIEFLRKLMPQYPMPVVMISGYTDMVFEALDAGAVDFVAKPKVSNFQAAEDMIDELIEKIKVAATARVGHGTALNQKIKASRELSPDVADTVLAIGASTGGTEAIYQILKDFPAQMPGIVVVQHMPADFTRMYAERIDRMCSLRVKEARDGDYVEPGLALIAPGQNQMQLAKAADGIKVKCRPGERVNGHCPSVDVLFNSVAENTGKKAIGVILTGMGADGAKGLLAMRQKGARTIGQDEESCVVYGMPRVAYEIGAVEKQVPLDNISQAILSYLNMR